MITSLLLSAALAADAEAIKGADVALVQAVRTIGERAAQMLGARAPLSMLALRADASVRAEQARLRAERLLPSARAAARGRAWADLGLGSADDPAALALALAGDLPGMTLDADGLRLLVDPGRLTEEESSGVGAHAASLLLATGVAPDEPVVAHYAVHMMPNALRLPERGTTDTLLTRAALAEGVANLAALLVLFSGVGLEAEVLNGTLTPEDALGGRLVSDAIRTDSPLVAGFVDFVYLDGFAAVAALARRTSVERLPAETAARSCTRDVLHPDRAPAAAAGVPDVPAPAGMLEADRDALGEQGVIAWVARLTGKDNLAMIAGDGWAADAVFRFEPTEGTGSPDAGITVWETAWLSDEDAKDFAYAVERALRGRFPAEQPSGAGDGPWILRRTDRSYRWERNGRRVGLRIASPAWELQQQESGKKKGATPRKGTGDR